MWILITRDVPVSKEYRPEWLGIYWSVPWIDAEHIKNTFWRFVCEDRGPVKKREKKEIPDVVFQNIHDEEKYPEDYKRLLKRFLTKDLFTGWVRGGLELNPANAMRVIVNNEAVKVWPYEYKSISNDKLRILIDAKEYKIIPSTTAEEKIENFILDEVGKVIYEEALLEGCTENEAKLMVIGIDVSERYEIPPLGWYRYVGPEIDESWKDVGMPLNERNHKRRALCHSQRLKKEV